MRSLRRILANLLLLVGGLFLLFFGSAVVYSHFAHYQTRLEAWPELSQYIEPLKWQPENPARIRILSIDGGAMHGIAALKILQYLEEKSGRPIADLFDMVAGPSTGAIIGVGLLTPGTNGKPKYSAHALLEDYVELGRKILSAPLYHRILSMNGLLGPRFTNHAKLITEAEVFKQVRFGHLLRPMSVPVFSLANGFVEFRNWIKTEANIFVAPLLAASTTVPSYFPAVHLDGNEDYNGFYTDALFVLNNPAHHAFLHVVERYPDAEIIVVSLGVSQRLSINSDDAVHGGLLDWLRPMFSMVMNGEDHMADAVLGRLQRIRASFKVKAFRIAPKIPTDSDPMDASEDQVDRLIQIADGYTAENRVQLDALLGLLTQGQNASPE
jgi:predicted acylesterase/phospholipase RssA